MSVQAQSQLEVDEYSRHVGTLKAGPTAKQKASQQNQAAYCNQQIEKKDKELNQKLQPGWTTVKTGQSTYTAHIAQSVRDGWNEARRNKHIESFTICVGSAGICAFPSILGDLELVPSKRVISSRPPVPRKERAGHNASRYTYCYSVKEATMQYEFKDLRIGEMSFAYIEQGQGESVVFVHGSGATDLRTWGQQIEPFAERYHVIAYSQRYHYPNLWVGDGSDIYSTTVHANDLVSLITALQLGRVHLIGFSYGADIVLRLAVEHPDLIRTLVITEPPLFSWLVTLPQGKELLDEYGSKIRPAKETVRNGDLEQGMRLYIDSFMGSGAFDQLPNSARERMMANVRLIGAETADANEIGPDITRGESSTIQAPTLMLTGGDSSEMFLLVSQELARYLPQVEQAQINDASHLLHVMNPQAYNATVLSFLAKYTG